MNIFCHRDDGHSFERICDTRIPPSPYPRSSQSCPQRCNLVKRIQSAETQGIRTERTRIGREPCPLVGSSDNNIWRGIPEVSCVAAYSAKVLCQDDAAFLARSKHKGCWMWLS